MYTAKESPNKNGSTVDFLDHDFNFFFKMDFSIKGPFHLDLLILLYLFFIFLEIVINLFLDLLVGLPFAGFPHGVTEGRPPEVLPSPPP